AGIEPDLVTIAKGVAGGFPLAAVVGVAEVMDAPLPGGLGGTYAGSPVGCEAALAVIDVIEEENLVGAATQIGERMGESLRALQARYPEVIGDVRAERGAMVAIELVHKGDAEQPNPELTKALVAEAAQRGLLLLSCGIRGNVIRFLPPLTIPNALLNEGLETLEASLARLIAAE
ncbi:MAG: 4-aminobutyrate--2-oxoglutarate transaminase, partial [bacterium TMED88]